MSSNRTIVVMLDPDGSGASLYDSLVEEGGFRPHRNPSARWALRGEGVVVTLYGSGKCVVQGSGADSFAERYLTAVAASGAGGKALLEPIEEDLIGTDESGKGDYFGPLVAAAVCVPKGQEAVLATLGVKDSKLVSDRAAAEAAKAIRAGYPNEVVVIGPERYNELYEQFRNLNPLLAWATARAIEGVIAKHPCRNVLSDKFGDEHLIANALEKKGIEVNLVQRVRAERNLAVAAASILARDAFLTGLKRLSKEIGHKLPKGAGAPVLAAARRIYQEGGREALAKIAKMHFRTTAKATGALF